MGTELYPQGISVVRNAYDHSGLWPASSSGKEIDLREEFYEFLYGSNTEIAKGRPGILRRMRTDDDGDLVICPCVDEKTGEPDKDTICPYCWGEGYLWDEEWITYYKMLVSSHEGLVRKNQPYKPGMSNIPFVFFYLEHDVVHFPILERRFIQSLQRRHSAQTTDESNTGVWQSFWIQSSQTGKDKVTSW
jgi:hypothetical protein